ncbi:cAMP-regulated phosphoprotein 21 isoform X2 [Bacillus rossius redtenbacheri]|uniref:cAMP-regulated phosphoprotein 21 isoform X2 n=1 Tax=Bacillus rossius redtenbacheri TaxID=93214 RepID=UPI002FDDF963
MARLEIPSIVVHNGSNSAPGSPVMERSLRAQRTLSKQAEIEENDEDEAVPPMTVCSVASSCHCQSEDGGACQAGAGAQDKPVPREESQKPAAVKQDGVGSEDKAPLPSRVRSHSKVKLLVRSHAMREETSSPPPDPEVHHTAPPPPPGNSLSVSRGNARHKLRHQGSSQGSVDSSSPCLSRDSSTEQYTDSTGIDLHQFILETLNRNYKDRSLLLKIEQELVSLAKDSKRSHQKFPQMSSYQRMLVHRVAAYFGMDHNVDQTGNAVVVNRTKSTRLPDVRFRELIRDELLFPEEPRRSILKRDSSSFEDGCNYKSPERQFSSDSHRSKSFEEREEEYEKARKRIFNRDDGSGEMYSLHSSQEDLRWSGDTQPWSSSESDNYGRLRPGGVHRVDDGQQLRPSRLLKVESFEGREILKANSMRNAVAKSYSFGGYPVSVLSRGDSCTSTHSAGARLLTKQDSGSSMSSRLSPSSSGYKSQSQRSDTMSATPSPTATPVSQLSLSGPANSQVVPGTVSPQHAPSQAVMWAVTSMAAVPPGSILINPDTGQPYLNSDGTVYHYDPANPPKVLAEEQSPPPASPPHQSTKVNSATSPSMSPTKVAAPSQVTTATSPSLPAARPPSPLPRPACQTFSHPQESSQQPPEMTFASFQHGGQPIMYAAYNVTPAYEQRHPDGGGVAMSDLSGYFMGLSMLDQRGGGDGPPSLSSVPYHPQPPTPTAAPAYWQPTPAHQSSLPPSQGPQQPVPMYFVPPPPPPLVNASPPQQQNGGSSSAPSTPRYVTAPSLSAFQQVPSNGSAVCHPAGQPHHQDRSHGGSYVPSYPVAGHLPSAPGGGGDCVPYYPQSSIHMLYTPTSMNVGTTPSTANPALHGGSLYYHSASPGHSQPVMGLPYMPPSQPYRAPTPPQTPTQAQTLCSVGAPFMYLNGGGYGSMYNGAAPNGSVPPNNPYGQQQPSGTPGPGQLVPSTLISNMGIFRSNMQMMSNVRSSPPPRATRDGVCNKPVYMARSSGNCKDRPGGGHHYDTCSTADKMPRYAPMPMIGFRLLPGPPLQQSLPCSSPALRIPFPLQQHLRGQHQPGPYHSPGPDITLGRPPKPKNKRSKMVATPPGNPGARPQSIGTSAQSPPATQTTAKDSSVRINGGLAEEGRSGAVPAEGKQQL